MIKGFPIDFVRQILEQKLFEEHNKNVNLYGGKNQVNIFSFYEQLRSQEEVDRFVKNFRELSEQQNRSGLILNGVLVSPENPTITNLYSCLIVPLSWSCSFRCILENRDNALVTLNNVIDKLKGKKVDVAQLQCVDENGTVYYDPFCVGTIGQDTNQLYFKNGDFLGDLSSNNIADTQMLIIYLKTKGVQFDLATKKYAYVGYKNKLTPISIVEDINPNDDIIETVYGIDNYDEENCTVLVKLDDGKTYLDVSYAQASITIIGENTTETITVYGYADYLDEEKVALRFTAQQPWSNYVNNETVSSLVLEEVSAIPFAYDIKIVDEEQDKIIIPQEHTSFEKFKVSMSLDAIRCDEPRNLNSHEYCEITISGNATLVNNGVKLGNDLLKLSMQKKLIKASTDIVFPSPTKYWLEPLEMPSGSNANTQISQLMSNKFLANTHTDSLALTLQYTFICDTNIALLKQFYNYARYGTQGLTQDDISPNIIYEVGELWCSWGDFEYNKVLTKLVENIDIENTESDTLTLSMTMQIQGEND